MLVNPPRVRRDKPIGREIAVSRPVIQERRLLIRIHAREPLNGVCFLVCAHFGDEIGHELKPLEIAEHEEPGPV